MLGRAEGSRPIYRSAEDRRASNIARTLAHHEVIPLYRAFEADPPAQYSHNRIWYETDDGVVHSSFIVPCREVLNAPEDTIGAGFWGEVTVPITYQHWEPNPESAYFNPLRYATVYRVIDRTDDSCGAAWYRLEDDVYPHQSWWARAAHIRRVRPEELTPISPDVPAEAKRIEVSITAQNLVCYEYDQPVFSTRLSSGGTYYDAGGSVYPFPTPWGEHRVQRKTPSRHMIGGEEINNPYDLPGVPWCTYFSATGEAIHGATTHNDFGAPRSHGCLNVTPDAAKWIYRWTAPTVDYDEAFYWLTPEDRDTATVVNVIGAYT